MNDFRYAFRMLLKSPGFSLVAIATLALGIGANSAVFTIIQGVILNPLPFKEPSRLVAVWETNRPPGAPANERNEVAKGNFRDWRAQNEVFEQIAALYFGSFNLVGLSEPERVSGAYVTANFFQTLGVQPRLGRAFLAGEEQASSTRVAIISYALWQRRFGGDPALIGQKAVVNGEPFIIVGVMPPTFQFQFPTGSLNPELWTPLRPSNDDTDRVSHFLYSFARLKPGVTIDQARSNMKLIARSLQQQYPDTNSVSGVNILSLHEQLTGDVQPYLYLLFTAVGLVLLIACANVGNLFLARLTNRSREFAVRLALGAGRGRLIRQLLVESLLLSLLGGAIGVLLAAFGVSALRALAPPDLPRLSEVHLNGAAVVWTLGILVLTALLFGLAPALQTTKPNLDSALHQSNRSSDGPKQNRLTRVLVISEIALALLLLISAGLLIKSSLLLQNVDPGFRRENLLTLNVALSRQKYSTSAQSNVFFTQLIERIRSLPGVVSCGGVDPLPMTGSDSTTGILIEGMPMLAPADRPESGERLATPGYFGAMGIPLRHGRDFTNDDRITTPPVVMVNEAFAHRFFPNGEALGKHVGLDNDGKIDWAEIVGVVGNIKHNRLNALIKPELYEPYQQHWRNFMSIAVRTSIAPTTLVPAIRAEVARLDPEQPIFAIATMNQQIAQTLAQNRFVTVLLTIFAALASALAAIGIYGVMAYLVTRRTREIGIRMALGAQRMDMLGMILRQSLIMVVVGLGLGVVAAFAATRLLASLLYGVGTSDFVTYASVVLLLGLAALLASYVPARRAMKVDPIVALRYE